MEKKEFRKKIFKKISKETLVPFPSIPAFPKEDPQTEHKLNVHFEKECKSLFVPLLDEIIQMQHHIKSKTQFYQLHSVQKQTKSNKDILQKLHQFKASIEESKRWCDSLLMQIEKGIEELEKTNTDTIPSTDWITQIKQKWKKP